MGGEFEQARGEGLLARGERVNEMVERGGASGEGGEKKWGEEW